MPSTVVNMGVATRTLVQEQLNATSKPSMVLVDNVLAILDSDLIFNDQFTPSATVATPAPLLQTIPRLQINVAAGECISVQDKLKDVEFLGLVQVVRNAGGADANCFVTYAYDFDEGDGDF